MNTKIRWVIIAFFSFTTVFLVNKGLDLWALGTNVDGNGIGIYFWGFEINDRVPEKSIPPYAIGFFAASLTTMTIAIALIRKALLKIKGNTPVN
jgi:hypothetical protein